MAGTRRQHKKEKRQKSDRRTERQGKPGQCLEGAGTQTGPRAQGGGHGGCPKKKSELDGSLPGFCLFRDLAPCRGHTSSMCACACACAHMRGQRAPGCLNGFGILLPEQMASEINLPRNLDGSEAVEVAMAGPLLISSHGSMAYKCQHRLWRGSPPWQSPRGNTLVRTSSPTAPRRAAELVGTGCPQPEVQGQQPDHTGETTPSQDSVPGLCGPGCADTVVVPATPSTGVQQQSPGAAPCWIQGEELPGFKGVKTGLPQSHKECPRLRAPDSWSPGWSSGDRSWCHLSGHATRIPPREPGRTPQPVT